MSTTTESKIADYTFSPWQCDDGKRIVAAEARWRKPLKWDEEAKAEGVRKRVFCASLADVFEDWQGPMHGNDGLKLHHGFTLSDSNQRWIGFESGAEESQVTMDDVRRRLFSMIDATPNLDWLLLTKRPDNVLKFTYDAWCKKVLGHVSQNEGDGRRWEYPKNVWVGTSVENQQAADERHKHLMRCPAAVHFWSAEPLLEHIDAAKVWEKYGKPSWVIVGGESGHGARPMHPDWARSLRDQCAAAGVPFFFKQWGDWQPYHSHDYYQESKPLACLKPSGETSWCAGDVVDGPLSNYSTNYEETDVAIERVGKKSAGRLLDGVEHNGKPEVME